MIADTSFLVALFLANDEHHEKAVKMSLEGKNEEIIILDRVLEETFTVLAYKKDIEFAVECIGKLRSNRRVLVYRLDAPEEEEIFEIARDIGQRMSYVDYAILLVSKKHGQKALTFDRQLEKEIKRQMRP
jgi:predicted nucleic acid-binding protein